MYIQNLLSLGQKTLGVVVDQLSGYRNATWLHSCDLSFLLDFSYSFPTATTLSGSQCLILPFYNSFFFFSKTMTPLSLFSSLGIKYAEVF